MSVQVKRRREAATFLASYAGAAGELLVDTTNNRLQVHDGTTNGGWGALGKSPAVIVEGKDASNAKHGGTISIACVEEEITLSGASTASTVAFPNQSLVLGASCRVTLAITGAATSFKVGRTGGTANEFGDLLALTLGTANQGTIGPAGNYASTTVTVTANGGNFAGGKVRLQLCYLVLNHPTS